MSFVAAAIGLGTAASIAGDVIAGNDAQKGIEQAQQRLDALQYTPINIDQIIQKAQQTAATNAATSLNLEKTLQPSVAGIRSLLPQQIQAQLKAGGNLPADIRNQITSAGLATAGASGLLGSGEAVPATAATTGTTATNLEQLYQNEAGQFLQQNPLPASGLDPGSVASAIIGNVNAQNQFNIQKAGGQAQLAQAAGQAQASEWGGALGALGGGLSGVAGMLNTQQLINGLKAPTTTGGGASPSSPAAAPTIMSGV